MLPLNEWRVLLSLDLMYGTFAIINFPCHPSMYFNIYPQNLTPLMGLDACNLHLRLLADVSDGKSSET